MTAYNMTAARQVIIHGDCWPGGECSAGSGQGDAP